MPATFRFAVLMSLALAGAVPAAAHNDEFAPVVPGAIGWTTLQQAQAIEWQDEQGVTHIKPGFGGEIAALDGKEVEVAGFPLKIEGAKGGAARLLLFAARPDCFFHMSVGPLGFVETDLAPTPGLSDEAMLLRGRLELVRADRGGVFYRLHDARPMVMPRS